MQKITNLFADPLMANVEISSDGYKEVAKKRSAAAEPIRDVDVIANICDSFKSRGKYRDNLLFVLGCNCGLRCGELLSIKWGQLVNPDGTIKDQATIIEEKNSKKNKETGEFIDGKIKTRDIYINDTVKDALALLASSKESISLNDYIFKSEAPSASYYSKQRADGHGAKHDHMTRQAVHKILRQTVNEILQYDIHASTHCMRKTYARFIWDNAPDQRSALAFLQKNLNHASSASTLHYIGVTQDEIKDVAFNLALGSHDAAASKVIAINTNKNNFRTEKKYG